MTVATKFISWNRGLEPGAPYDGASPNLQALAAYCHGRWKLKSLGIYSRRPIRGGTSWSSHAFGAAVDLGFGERHGGPGIAVLEAEILPWLIANSAELGIQRIHHYQRTRYWEAGRGWVDKSPGQGHDWIHVETTRDAWADASPVRERLLEAPQSPASAPSAPAPPKYPGRPLKRSSTGAAVKLIQTRLGLTADGKFGPQTEAAVKAWQTANALQPDGVVGPATWARMFGA